MSSGAHDAVGQPLRLIADIGGTNARFALLRGLDIHAEQVLPCADFPDIVTATEHYLRMVGADVAGKRPVHAAVAIAGPVIGDLIRMTNHVWQFSAAGMRKSVV